MWRHPASRSQACRPPHPSPRPSRPAVRTEPCGNIRRINVEIPSLSLSDMRRLKATDKVRRTRSMPWARMPAWVPDLLMAAQRLDPAVADTLEQLRPPPPPPPPRLPHCRAHVCRLAPTLCSRRPTTAPLSSTCTSRGPSRVGRQAMHHCWVPSSRSKQGHPAAALAASQLAGGRRWPGCLPTSRRLIPPRLLQPRTPTLALPSTRCRLRQPCDDSRPRHACGAGRCGPGHAVWAVRLQV